MRGSHCASLASLALALLAALLAVGLPGARAGLYQQSAAIYAVGDGRLGGLNSVAAGSQFDPVSLNDPTLKEVADFLVGPFPFSVAVCICRLARHSRMPTSLFSPDTAPLFWAPFQHLSPDSNPRNYCVYCCATLAYCRSLRSIGGSPQPLACGPCGRSLPPASRHL